MKKLVAIMLFVQCCFVYAGAQQLPAATEQQLENLSDETEEETEDDALLQQLQYYSVHPLNVNVASASDLQWFKWLTPLQISSFLQYRNLFQNLISIYELQAVPLWDVATIRKLLPYITVRAQEQNIRSRFAGGEHRLLLRNSRIIEPQKGYDQLRPTHFLGSRNHLLFRYKFQYKNQLQYGLTGDKDAGEAFFKNGQRSGFDFYSAHFFARNLGIVKAVALGDFTVNLGQGLVQWQALAFKKSAEPMAIVRQAPVLLPYQSAGEILFNRGAGITVQKGAWEATMFASIRRSSANVTSDSAQTYFTSFSTSGLHRTLSELADKNAVRQMAFGGNIKWRSQRLMLGLNGVQHHFSEPLQKRDEPYNLYAINGSNWYNISLDYTAVYRNLYFFGEAATDKRQNLAFLNGLIASIHPKIDVSLLQRHLSPRYQTLYGNAVTENGLPSNEHGFYLGLTVRPTAAWRVNGYADFFKFPWLKYRVDAPSAGQEYLVQLTYQPNKKLEAYARFRQEEKALNDFETDSAVHVVRPRLRQNFRAHLTYRISPTLSLKARAEAVLYDVRRGDAEKGFLVFVETGHDLLKKVRATTRLQYFTTGGYNSRIYAYESDVLFSYSIPAFFDTGLRYYCNLQYDVFKKFAVWLRWSQTVYRNQQTIGSGLTAIAGNTRSELKCQASYLF